MAHKIPPTRSTRVGGIFALSKKLISAIFLSELLQITERAFLFLAKCQDLFGKREEGSELDYELACLVGTCVRLHLDY